MAEEIKTDYLIAGGGVAGILLASRLAVTGKRVVMLDQGPRITEEDRGDLLARSIESLNVFTDYNDRLDPSMVTPLSSAPAGKDVAEWNNYRLFGIGGTALHYMALMIRPREEDLKVRTLYGYGRDWPISYAELEPWLLMAENAVGVAGDDDNPYASRRSGPFPMPGHKFSYFAREIMAPALKRLGMTGHSCPRAINSTSYHGRSACMGCRACIFCPSGARYSPDRVHMKELEARDNVTVIDRLSLRRLETGPDGKRIVAAHAMYLPEKKPAVITADSFVLSMGGVETPRMLMLSAGRGPHAEGLGNMGGQLGRGFSDHFNPFVTYDLGRHAGRRLGFETIISDHYRVNVNRREEPAFMIFGSPSMDWYPVGNDAVRWAASESVLRLDELRSSIQRMASLYIMTELEGGGSLELDPSKSDTLGDPVAKVTMRLTGRDRLSLERFKTLAPKIGEAMGAKAVSDISSDPGLGYHPSGATAMAKTPDDGVCDPDLKVFGLDNLYLVSNSVFPHMGANPPTLIIAALALRLAAHLMERDSA